MAKGKAKSTLLGIQGVVGHRTAPDYDFIYTISSQKNPNYNIGDRVVLPDGRVFRYAKCNAVRTTGYACAFNFRGAGSNGGAIIARATNVQTATSIGDKEIKVTVASSDGELATGILAEDELRGGYLVIFGDSNLRENRGIVGNTAVAVGGGTTTIYLDAALLGAHATTITLGVEVFPNPWGYMGMLAEDYLSFGGFPPDDSMAVDDYFWVQTWGPCRISGQNFNLGNAAGERNVWFGPDGSMRGATFQGTSRQRAGFIIQRTGAALGSSPFVMLQVCP